MKFDFKNIAVWRLIGIVISVLFSIFAGFLFQPLISDNSNAVNTIVTIFSILAGFLIAAISLITEPVLAQAKTWQELQLYKKGLENRMFRHKILFFMYLATLALAVLMFMIPEDCREILIWLERGFVCIAVLVFIGSFALPNTIIQIQMQKYKNALNEKLPASLKDD